MIGEQSFRIFQYDQFEPILSKQNIYIHQLGCQQCNLLIQFKENQLRLVYGQKPHQIIEKLEVELNQLKKENGNHRFFWESLISGKQRAIQIDSNSPLVGFINKQWGNIENFKQDFIRVSLSNSGSGWCWMVWDNLINQLDVVYSANNQTPISMRVTPIFCIDLWEHAYCLDYQEKKDVYLKNIWTLLNWQTIERRFIEAAFIQNSGSGFPKL